MKEQIYSVLCALYMGCFVLFTSCTSDDKFINPDDENPVIEDVAYMSLHFITEGTTGTKSIIPADKLNAWEHRVTGVWILLYKEEENTSNHILEYKFEYSVSNYENGALIQFKDTDPDPDNHVIVSSNELQFTTIAESVERQNYKMVILVNPKETLGKLGLNINKGQKLSELLAEMGQNINTNFFGGNEDNSLPFFMSNANGVISVPTAKLQSTPEEAQADPISVKVDRLLSKVEVREKDSGATTPTGVILDSESVKWHLDVVNKKTFLIREFANYADDCPTIGGTLENEENSAKTDRKYIYAKDPNFTKGALSDFQRKGDQGYLPEMTKWIAHNRSTTDESVTYQYTFENTLDLDTQKEDDEWANYTTQIVLHANLFYEDFLIDKNDWENENDPGRNYYSYLTDADEWKVFTHEQVRFWIERGFPTEMGDLEDKVKENLDERALGNSNTFDFTSSNDPGKTEDKYNTFFDITYHPQGLNIYRIPIRHFKPSSGINDPRKELYGYYGVVRNNRYAVTINSLSGPGTNYVDPETHFISVDITITPWYRRDFQEEELEY